MTISPKHRAALGIHWNFSRPGTKCKHPLQGYRKTKPDRGISVEVSKAIKDQWGQLITVGAGKVFPLRISFTYYENTNH